MYAGTRIWSSYNLVQLARFRHCVSWSLGCLTSTWDIVHGTSQHLTLFAARSSFPKMSNVGTSPCSRTVNDGRVGPQEQVCPRRRRRPNLFRHRGLGLDHHAWASQTREDSRWSRL